MPNLGTTELLLILGIVVLLFGASRLPAVGRGLGQSIRGFQMALADRDEEREEAALPAVKDEAR